MPIPQLYRHYFLAEERRKEVESRLAVLVRNAQNAGDKDFKKYVKELTDG